MCIGWTCDGWTGPGKDGTEGQGRETSGGGPVTGPTSSHTRWLSTPAG